MIESIRLGQVTVGILSRIPKLVQPHSDASPYVSALEALSRLLAPDSWALAGGLAVPVSVGRFYRRHADIDIALALHRMPEVVNAFRSGGYRLCTCWSVSHGGRGILFECRIKSDGALMRVRQRHLYVKRRTPGAAGLLDKIDLYPYRIRGDRFETCNTHRLLAGRAIQRSSLRPFGRPGHIACLHLDNIALLKSSRSGPKHRLDCAVIRGGPDAARDWFRRYQPVPVPAIGTMTGKPAL